MRRSRVPTGPYRRQRVHQRDRAKPCGTKSQERQHGHDDQLVTDIVTRQQKVRQPLAQKAKHLGAHRSRGWPLGIQTLILTGGLVQDDRLLTTINELACEVTPQKAKQCYTVGAVDITNHRPVVASNHRTRGHARHAVDAPQHHQESNQQG